MGLNVELADAIRGFEILLGWSLVLQTLEYLRIVRLDVVSDWSLQRLEVPARPRAVRALLDLLLQERPYRLMLLLRLALALCLIFGGLGLGGALLLFGIALVLLMRWRGAFNGGSDFMTLVGLSGLLIAHGVGAFADPVLGWRAGLWYVTLQSVTSYFVSGWVKLLRPEWRSGEALAVFLDTGVYGPLPAHSLYRHPLLARACSWAFTVWEGCFPLALLDVRLALGFCAVAALFHFLVFWFFGLNRFFWAWLSTYPAILYCATQVAS
jgi:hypothetical protein